MIIYTFLLPCKNEEKNMTALFSWSRIDQRQIRKRYQSVLTAFLTMISSSGYSPNQRFAVINDKYLKNSCLNIRILSYMVVSLGMLFN